jgi:hypothetical protein
MEFQFPGLEKFSAAEGEGVRCVVTNDEEGWR